MRIELARRLARHRAAQDVISEAVAVGLGVCGGKALMGASGVLQPLWL
jgi:hypothetical protein